MRSERRASRWVETASLDGSSSLDAGEEAAEERWKEERETLVAEAEDSEGEGGRGWKARAERRRSPVGALQMAAVSAL
eukprot:scaffold79522_cov29-Tisochrysis_lutea.AAC.1